MATAPTDWRAWPVEQKEALHARLTERLRRKPWRLVARPSQMPPAGDWFIWLILAGRGWGKTRVGAEWVADKARRHPGVRIAIVGQTYQDARDTMVEGESGLLSVLADEELRAGTRDTAWNRSIGELFLANGSRFKVFSSEKPNRLRGPQHHFAWGDEPATWLDAHKGPEVDTTWSNLEIGCRLDPDGEGAEPQILLTGTPKPTRLLTRRERRPFGLLHREGVIVTRGHTTENIDNLSRGYRARVIDPLKGTRLARQELAGEILEDVEGALWKREWIDALRVPYAPAVEYRAATVSLDPADGTEAGDELATCVAAIGLDNDFYVIESRGCRDKTQVQWITEALHLCREYNAKLVWERNHGGAALRELIEMVMGQTGIRVPTREVWASTGKTTRAEPVAALYEGGAVRTQGRVRHIGEHLELEEQMTTYTGAKARPGAQAEKSPDRMDALVWCLYDLMGYGTPPGYGGEIDEDVARYHEGTSEVERWQ